MFAYHGKYLRKQEKKRAGFGLILLSFFNMELFGWFFLSGAETFVPAKLWPLAFGALWAVILTGLLEILPAKVSRVVYGLVYFLTAVYTGFQTGYFILFSQMMWLSDFRYASEGADYADVLLSYPAFWWLGIIGMILLGTVLLRRYPLRKSCWKKRILPGILAVIAAVSAFFLPQAVFASDSGIKYAGSDYGRSQSAEAAYTNMFNTHRLYQVCGLYQTLAKDIYTNAIYPLTPSHALAQAEAVREVDAYFAEKPHSSDNAMTGLLKGKNVVLVLMESMDDWMIGEYTPTLVRLMEEGLEFTNFYTPVYGGIRTFNTEFCINTGSYLSSRGGYAFDYVTNTYRQSLASQLRQRGYSAKTFHYNDPTFYSRGEFSPAMGYEEYVSYGRYIEETDEKARNNLLYDDCFLFEDAQLKEEFFRKGQPTLNFVITRSAHLSYKYNEVLSHWGLKKYPQFRGLTGNEETDCAYLKAKLVDDFFARLLTELEEQGQLENTVIIGITDHYTYGYKDTVSLLELSGVEQTLLLEKTPCFIWSKDLAPQKIGKVLHTADFLPTVLNLLGVDSQFDYIGQDAFADGGETFVPFSNGSWICADTAYDAGSKTCFSISGAQQTISAQTQKARNEAVQRFIRINNLILETDYYKNGG